MQVELGPQPCIPQRLETLVSGNQRHFDFLQGGLVSAFLPAALAPAAGGAFRVVVTETRLWETDDADVFGEYEGSVENEEAYVVD